MKMGTITTVIKKNYIILITSSTSASWFLAAVAWDMQLISFRSAAS